MKSYENGELRDAVNAEGRAKHRERVAGIDCSVCWLTKKNVMERAGVTESQLSYHMRTKKIEVAHDGSGRSPTLFHPDAVARYVAVIEAERNKEKQQCR